MTTPKPTTIYAMDRTQATAWLTQLDAMLNVLTYGDDDSIDETATAAGDLPVSRMIARLYEARQAAHEIATRPQPVRRGVSLRRNP